MKKTMIFMALIMSASLAQAQKGNYKMKTEPVKTRDGQVISGANAKVSGASATNMKLVELQKMLEPAVKENKTIKTTDGQLTEAYTSSVKNIQNATVRETALRLTEYLVAFAKAGDVANLKFVAKVMDLASREDVGANNKIYQGLLDGLVRNLFDTRDLGTAIERTVNKERRQQIEDCV